MGKKDKVPQNRSEIDEIIRQSSYCHLSCCRDELPYVIPVAFGYDGQAIYIHTAPTGKKIEIFEENPQVCIAFVSQAEVIKDLDEACKWAFHYASVIADGVISEVTEPGAKTAALNQIMTHYSGRGDWEMPAKSQAGTRVWKVKIENITKKTSSPS